MVTANDTRKLTAASVSAGSGSHCPKYLPAAASAALMVSETTNRKPTASTMPKENARCRSNCRRPTPSGRRASHTRFRIARSSANTLEAPNSSVARPTTLAKVLACELRAFQISAWIASAPCGPTMPRTWSATCTAAAFSPKARPTIATTSTIIGASDSIE